MDSSYFNRKHVNHDKCLHTKHPTEPLKKYICECENRKILIYLYFSQKSFAKSENGHFKNVQNRFRPWRFGKKSKKSDCDHNALISKK
jgi:hypothetical protein